MSKNIIGDYIIIDEKSFAASTFGASFQIHDGFSSIEFDRTGCVLRDIGNVASSSSAGIPLAQIVSWSWGKKKEDWVINETNVLTRGGSLFLRTGGAITYVVRILKKRAANNANPCPALNTKDALTFQISDKKVTVSAHWLMSVSPMIKGMLSVGTDDKHQQTIALDALGVDMDQFLTFLEAISLSALTTPILPNSQNVLMLLKLADFFQVDFLLERCEEHLFNCVEIPLIDRFLLIEKYQLTRLKDFFFRLDIAVLRAFLGANFRKIFETPGVSEGLKRELGVIQQDFTH
ncbi:hypothetical protein niasHT_035101 [Heterodera trifolii]|uniref:BTB domain-containing protein n=1 Tax=Heterodera trifolii TaxID=157864 RepID=A0ABD2IHK8_9BILA